MLHSNIRGVGAEPRKYVDLMSYEVMMREGRKQ